MYHEPSRVVSDNFRSTLINFNMLLGEHAPRPPRVVSHYIHPHQVPLYVTPPPQKKKKNFLNLWIHPGTYHLPGSTSL